MQCSFGGGNAKSCIQDLSPNRGFDHPVRAQSVTHPRLASPGLPRTMLIIPAFSG